MKSRSPFRPQAYARARSMRVSWPDGATAGLLLMAAACVGLSAMLYQLAGPNETFAAEAADR